MKKYQSHKVVQATKIPQTWEETLRVDSDLVVVEIETGESFTLKSTAFGATARDPGYIVVYEDGYTSWSPAAVFEAGYTELPELEQTAAPDLYRSKPEIVHAWQIDFTQWRPKWVNEAIDTTVIEILEDGGALVHQDRGAIYAAGPGDWLIRDHLLDISTCKAKDFRAQYEQIQG